MESIEFWKMSGSGNDFILIDNRNGDIKDEEMGRLVAGTCRRRESVGADGVIFLIRSDRYDFAWRFFNADGGEVDMCGNGARCVSRFAFLKGIAQPKMTFDGKDLYPTLIEKAAALGYSIIINHPFIDGNKRVSFFATDVFLRINGYYIDCDSESAYRFFITLLESGTFIFNELLAWLNKHIRSI